MNNHARVAVIGGGLMGREVASALGRWFVLNSFPIRAELVAVCDVAAPQRNWFQQLPGVQLVTDSYRTLLESADVDVVYVAVPHQLHEEIYLAVLAAGKDLLAEKPFGIDVRAARRIRDAARSSKCFVRCSSEFPFLPGAQRAYQIGREGHFGKLLEVRCGFHHSSDLDPTKPANWKRQVKTCGEIGVMGDLGVHVLHIPLRLGWNPKRVYAQLQKVYHERPDGAGGMAACDTWDNAMLHTEIGVDGVEVPARFEMKRLAPGETNSWFIEFLGTDGGVKYSTKEPKTLWLFQRSKEQCWQRVDLGFHGPFATITGAIFEPGFPDCFQQMWAAFLAERAGLLHDNFGCVTPDEAVRTHEIFAAALESHAHRRAIEV
jgi:predicted dehydrogenase